MAGYRKRELDRRCVREVFCENLLFYRRRCCMTQLELSHAADVSRSQISAFEQGCSYPSFETIIKLAEALHIEEWKLLYDRAAVRRQQVRSNA